MASDAELHVVCDPAVPGSASPMVWSERTDEELMAASAAGRRDAFEVLVAWYLPRLAASDATRVLPSGVVLDGVAAGPLGVIVVIGAERLQVSAIERLRGAEFAATALQRRFVSAAVSELRLEVSL